MIIFENKNQKIKYIELKEKLYYFMNERYNGYYISNAETCRIDNSIARLKNELLKFERKNPEVMV